MKRIITIALVALAVCAHPAAAGTPPEPWLPVVDARVAAALAIAGDYWAGAVPNCEGYELFEARLPRYVAGLAEQPGCRMWLSRRVLVLDRSPAAARRKQNAFLCVVVVHEYGHLLGYGHVHDPRSVMFDGGLDPKVVPACRRMLARPRMVPSRR